MKALVRADLSKEKQSAFHQQILTDSRALVELSRQAMAANWTVWDANNQTFHCLRDRDADDQAKASRKEPEKMVVPLTYAQLTTFVAFVYSLLTQRESLFELSGFTVEDEKPAQVGEALLNRDLAYNKFQLKLLQHLLDVGRFGLGVMKIHWETRTRKQTITKQIAPVQVQGLPLTEPFTIQTVEDVVEYQGNIFTNISPYRFYPDPRVPLTKFQEGAFCGSEEVITRETLKLWEHQGLAAGVDYVSECSPEYAAAHGFADFAENSTSMDRMAATRGDGQVKRPVIITELQREIIPSQYMVDGEPIGNEDYPIKYLIVIANGSRVIRCEPLGYNHNKFTYVATPFTYDDNAGTTTFALSDITKALQEVITWFINSRVTNVTRVIGDKLVVDTSAVNMQDVINRSPVIRLNATATAGVDRYIQQLKLQDVTQAHVGDAQYLTNLMQLVTGISDTIQGIMQPGRKSASQVNKTVANAANRLKLCADVAWLTGLAPLGEQALSNLQQGLDTETYVKLLGVQAVETPEFLPVTSADLVGKYQFVIYDGSQPSDRYYNAQAIEELLALCMSNPIAAVQLGLDPRKLLLESLRLRNIRNAQRFLLDPIQQQQQLLMYGTAGTNQTSSAAPTTGGNAEPVGQPVLPGLSLAALSGGDSATSPTA